MSIPFFYTARVDINGVNQGEIPIYAFKPGDLAGSPFHLGDVNLQLMRNIALRADGARMLK